MAIFNPMPAKSISLILVGGVSALSLYWYVRKRLEDAREPPSVGRYPLVGSRYHLPEPLFLSLYERYGNEPIVRVHFGTQCVYVFNRWGAFREAMLDNAEQLSGRAGKQFNELLFGSSGGLVDSDGEIWREYRRFTVKTLREFGLGRRGAEEAIMAEAEHMRRTIDNAQGEPLQTLNLMSTATTNIIGQLVFGSRLASEESRFDRIIELFRSVTNGDRNSSNAVFFTLAPLIEKVPFLGRLLMRTKESKAIRDAYQQLKDYCHQQQVKHAAEMEGVDRARDYIEAHLMHQGSKSEIFNDARLTMAISDMFIAGSDTSANTLCWALLYMLENPEVAKRVRAEIDDTIGWDRLPTMQDRTSLNYTQAVIEEVHRRACLVPLGLFHRVTEDITVDGVHLKAETICTFNMYAIHHDPELFPEPEKFRPERHLTPDGLFQPCPQLAAFGLGKRACLGESLARMELFIFFVALMQRYQFGLDPEDGRSLWDLTEDPSFMKGVFIRSPPLHRLAFSPR